MSTASPRSKAASGLVVRVLAALIVASAIVVALAGPASAHIGLSESDPVNVSTVEGPVSEIRLAFTGAADAVEDQFALTAGGVEVRIASIENDGADVLVVTAEEPLATGRVKLNWAIRSGDSHTMTGSITFTVATASDSAPAAAATPTPGSEAQPQSSGSAATDDAVSRAAAGLAAEQTGGGAPAKGPADHVATAARWLVYGALLFCVGGLGYLAWVHRGTAAEGRGLVFYVRRAALVVMVGAVVEWLAQVVLFGGGELEALWSPTAWGDVLAASFSVGTVLRLVGAGLVLAFLRIDFDHGFVLDEPRGFDLAFFDDDIRPPGTGAVAVDAGPTTTPLTRLRVEASPMALLGAAALVLSEAFIGHTSSVGPRVVVLVGDAGHLVAAALWAAGTFMLAMTLARRHRRGEPLDAKLLATRFSVMAGWALAGVAATGMVLAWAILDGVSGLWSTEFGRLLLAKVTVVAVIGAIGGHNHRVLVPALTRGDDAEDDAERFRRTVAVEAALFGVVLALTALLVVSSPV